MAKIPYVGVQSPFGNRGPDNPTPMNADTRGITNGMEAFTSAVMGIGNAAANVVEADMLRDQALARAEASNYGLDDQIALDAKADEFTTKLRSGEIPWDQAEQLFSEAVDSREVPEIPGLNDIDKLNFEKLRQRNAFIAKQKYQSTVGQYKKDYGEAQVYGTREKLMTFAESPDADPDAIIAQGNALRPLWTQLGGDESKWEKDSAAFKDKVNATSFAARFNTMQDSPEQLANLKGELSADGYWGQRLGPEKAGTALRQIDARMTQIRVHKDQQDRKQEKLAEALVNEVSKQLEVGQNPGVERLNLAASMSAGYPLIKAQLDEAQAVGAFVSDLMTKPTAVQQQTISQMRSDLDRDGGTADQYARLDKIEKSVKIRQEFRKNNPIEEIERGGFQYPPVDFSQPDQIGIELATRMAGLDSARERNPDLGNYLLKPHEATQLIESIKKLSPAQQAGYIGSLYNGIGNDDAYGRVMAQVAQKDPILAMAGRRFGSDMAANRDAGVAIGILKGHALLAKKDEGLVMPKASEIGLAFSEAVGTAYANRPDDLRMDVQAVQAYYANATAEAGDVTGEFNQERWNDAMEKVIGKPSVYEGHSVIRPIGMDEESFMQRADLAVSALAKQYNLNTGWLAPDLSLRNVPGKPGFYFLISETGSPVRDENDNALGINLND